MNEEALALGTLVGADAGAPGVVLVHDVWGLAEHTRDLARRLAAEGYAVLAIDLYHRERAARGDGSVEITDAGAWIRALPDRRVLEDLRAGAALLRERGAARVGVTGFCMGGMYALLSACEAAGEVAFDCAVPYYGMLAHGAGLLEAPLDTEKKPIAPLAAAARLGCPLLAFFGDQDTFIPVSDVEQLRVRLADSASESDPARNSEVVVYEGAGHAFMNDTRPEAYRPEAAADAWARMLRFLDRWLRRQQG